MVETLGAVKGGGKDSHTTTIGVMDMDGWRKLRFCGYLGGGGEGKGRGEREGRRR